MFNNLDDEESIDDDQLPAALSQQLGQLIMGAAQQFNAENPNLDINFFAPVIGGEENFDMDPDEDYLFDSDSDSCMEDGDESTQQIFTSLGDSHVVRRLSFHKNVENVYRFPRLTSNSDHCYEEIYRLLEEIELLCKVWRRRVEHPYTAHIAPQSPPPVSQSDSCLREGEDYNSSDYEFDSDEEEDYDQPPGGVNETLTKKKFCQSAKLFHQLFPSVRQFETFQRYLSKIKKYVFRVIFQLFLDTLPPATRYSIPQELWEKIWKFTQNSYFRYKSSVPLLLDNTYYKSGLRAGSSDIAGLEKSRIGDLFGALGNIHMLVFEGLFKNPHILQPSPIFELEMGGGGIEDHCRSLWKSSIQGARTAFTRMQHLDQMFSDTMENSDVSEVYNFGSDLSIQLESGCVVISDISLNLDIEGYTLDPSSSLIVSQSVCPIFCLLGRYSMDENRYGLLLVLVEAESGNVVQIIETGHSYENHLIDVGSHRVRRKGGQDWKKHFYLSNNRISLMCRNTDSEKDHIKIWTFPIQGEGKINKNVLPIVDSVVATSSSSLFRHNAVASISHTDSGVLLVHQSPFSMMTTATMYSINSSEMLLSICWNEDIMFLGTHMNSRALLRSKTNRTLMLFSLLSGEVVCVWRETDLNSEFGVVGGDSWSAVFDSCVNCNQLLLFTRTLSAYKLVEFDPNNEMIRPRTLLTGQIVGAIDGLSPSVRLLGNVLFNNANRELVSMDSNQEKHVKCHEVVGFSLNQRSKHNIVNMGSDRRTAGEALLNEISFKWWDEPGFFPLEGNWDPEKRPMFFIAPHKAAVLLEDCSVIRTFDMGMSPRAVIESELAEYRKET